MEHLKEINARRNKMKVKECLWCSDKNAIKSHFIQEKKLKIIANNGEVFYIDYLNHYNNLDFKKIGCKKATTMTAFCQKHDKEIFKEIEDKPYENTELQNLEYFIRTIAKEFQLKKEFEKSLFDQFYLKSFCEIDNALNAVNYIIPRFNELKNLYNSVKSIENKNIVKEKIDKVISTIYLKLDYPCGFIFSKAIVYKELFIPHNLPIISINIFIENNQTHIVVSYFNDSRNIESVKNFLNFLQIKESQLIFLSSILLENNHNIYFSYDFISKLSINLKKDILEYSIFRSADIRTIFSIFSPYNVFSDIFYKSFFKILLLLNKNQIDEEYLKLLSYGTYKKYYFFKNCNLKFNLFSIIKNKVYAT
ncbi:hypothetical protein [Fusobacterium polymorphum]|uniref:Uncharacterized protein n=1 Tax=Fusobacterium nucleatum subsp. polymorphum TaxID=76857 RepID=A0A241Q3K1_FUSNP|nr:hypothetical protein [Fusobacterium polymorphum]ASG29179.1 hypothetical protein CBG61_09975 [Fusobacterium polymorphum]